MKTTSKKKTASLAKADNTSRKEQNRERLRKIGFKSGDPRINRGGRPKGSRNKFGEEFVADFLEDWQKHGKQALKDVRTLDPAAYIKAACVILPKELNINVDERQLDKLMEQFNDEELDQFIAGVAALGIRSQSKEGKAKATTGSKSNSIH